MERWIFWVMLNFETQLPRMCTHFVICLSSILFDGQGKLDYIKWHDQRRYKKPHKRKSITRYTIKETSNEYEKVEDDPRQCLANRHPQTHGNRTNFMIFLPCIYFLTGNSRISKQNTWLPIPMIHICPRFKRPMEDKIKCQFWISYIRAVIDPPYETCPRRKNTHACTDSKGV